MALKERKTFLLFYGQVWNFYEIFRWRAQASHAAGVLRDVRGREPPWPCVCAKPPRGSVFSALCAGSGKCLCSQVRAGSPTPPPPRTCSCPLERPLLSARLWPKAPRIPVYTAKVHKAPFQTESPIQGTLCISYGDKRISSHSFVTIAKHGPTQF